MARSWLCSALSVWFSGLIITRLNPSMRSGSTSDEAVLMMSSIMRSLAAADSSEWSPLTSPHFRTFCMNGDNNALNRLSSASSSIGKKTNWSHTFFSMVIFWKSIKISFHFFKITLLRRPKRALTQFCHTRRGLCSNLSEMPLLMRTSGCRPCGPLLFLPFPNQSRPFQSFRLVHWPSRSRRANCLAF